MPKHSQPSPLLPRPFQAILMVKCPLYHGPCFPTHKVLTPHQRADRKIPVPVFENQHSRQNAGFGTCSLAEPEPLEDPYRGRSRASTATTHATLRTCLSTGRSPPAHWPLTSPRLWNPGRGTLAGHGCARRSLLQRGKRRGGGGSAALVNQVASTVWVGTWLFKDYAGSVDERSLCVGLLPSSCFSPWFLRFLQPVPSLRRQSGQDLGLTCAEDAGRAPDRCHKVGREERNHFQQLDT